MKRFWRTYRSDLLCLMLLLGLPWLLYASVSLGGKTLLPADILYQFQPYRAAAPTFDALPAQNSLLGDLILQNYPWKQLLRQAIETRTLPLWDPYLFTGHPFLANGQHSALYPLNIVFYLLPLPRAYGIFTALQVGLAGVWMYLFAKTLGTGRLGALLAGIAWQLSGFLTVSVVHPMIIAAASWLPLLLLWIELIVRRAAFLGQERATLPWVLGGAVTLGLQLLAGHAEITYFVLLVMGAFALWRSLYIAGHTAREHWRQTLLSPVVGLLGFVALGLGLGAVQFLPLYEVAHESFRQGSATLAQVLSWAYPWRRVITFLVPNFFGNPAHHTLYDLFTGEWVSATVNAYGDPITSFDWGIKNYVEGGVYLGLLTLALALIGIVGVAGRNEEEASGFVAALRRWWRHPYIPFFTLLSLFSLGCIFGTPVYALVYQLPFLNQSHSPFRWVFPLTLSAAVLAAFGAQRVTLFRWTRGPDKGARANPRGVGRLLLFGASPNLVSLVAALCLWGGVGLLGATWASRLLFPHFEPWVERAFWSLAKAAYAFPDHRAFYAYLFPWVQRAALLLIITGVVLRVSRCPIYLPRRWGGRPVWQALAVFVLIFDLLLFGMGFSPAVDPALLDYTPPVVDFLRQDTDLWRFSTFDPHGTKVFDANVGMFYGFQDVRGYDSLFSAQYARYMGWIEPQGELLYNRIAPFKSFASLDSPLTDLLNVRYILTEEEIPLPKYQLVYDDGAVRVYENLGVMPRAFTLPQAATLVVSDVEEIGALVQRYDPRSYVIIEADFGFAPTSLLNLSPYVPQTVTEYSALEVSVDALSQDASWLILADAYDVGWKAFVRPLGADSDAEVEVPIARVAGHFRGVQLEPGAWTVRFRYSPNSVKIGAFLSFLSGMTLLFLAILWLWRRTYHEAVESSTVQRVAKNSLAPILLNLFNRVIDFALAALMLRVLGPAGAGDYYYAIVLFGWFDIFTNFGLNAYLTREVARHPEDANRYLFNTTAMRLLLSGLGIPALVIFLLLRQGIVSPPLSSPALLTIGLLYLGLIPNSISTGLTALFYAYEKAEYPAALQTLSSLLKAALGTGVLLAGWGIVGLASSAVLINLVNLAILAVLAVRLFFRPRWELDRSLHREMVHESWSLMLNHLLASLFFKIDVILLESWHGNMVVGWYSTAYKFLDALNIIPSMFTMAIFPVVSRQAQEDTQALTRFYRLSIKLLVTLALPLALTTTLLARELVLLLGDRAYLPHSMIALQLMIWSIPIGWINSLTNYVLIALNRQRYLTRAFVIGFSLNLVGNLLFMPRYGYVASAITTILSEIALLIPFAIGLQREIGRIHWRQLLWRPLAAGAAAGLLVVLLLPLGRGIALLGVLAYPLVLWRVGLLSAEERRLLQPLWRR